MTHTVYKVVDIRFGAYFSFIATGEISVEYEIKKKIKSSTPLFVFETEEEAIRYMRQYPHSGVLEGTTTKKPEIPSRYIILDVEHTERDKETVEAFWKEYNNPQSWNFPVPEDDIRALLQINTRFVYDFTPQRLVAWNDENAYYQRSAK
jgi:hypothetical protein